MAATEETTASEQHHQERKQHLLCPPVNSTYLRAFVCSLKYFLIHFFSSKSNIDLLVWHGKVSFHFVADFAD